MAIRAPSHHFELLDSANISLSPQEVEKALASSLLLCLYELCEGSGSGGWQAHLNDARRLIRKTAGVDVDMLQDAITPASAIRGASLLPQIDHFMVEFFIYHDSLATVTVFSEPVLTPRVYHDVNANSPTFRTASAPEGPYVVGVRDGLFDIIGPISALRAKAQKKFDGIIVCEAVQLWQRLSGWEPAARMDVEYRLIGSLYQWALFIWLFSIIYPDDITNAKVQLAVKEGLGCMRQIEPASGSMSCSLFPLFILGSSAVDPVDRNSVLAEFLRLQSWSGLRNVSLALEIVKKMWSKYDNQGARPWDWVKESEEHGLVLLVT